MWTTLALCVLATVLGSSTQQSYSSHSSGYGPSHGAPHFDPKELEKLATAAHRVANEKIFLKDRLVMLKTQKQELFDRLDQIENEIIAAFEWVDATQDTRLIEIKDKIKALLHRLGDLEARVAGASAVAERNQACLPSLAARIEELTQSNIDQNAQLQKISTFLDEAQEKLQEKLGFTVEGAQDDVTTVREATVAFAELLNTRKCEVDFAEVPINFTSGEGSIDLYFAGNDTFHGNVPVVFCGVQGFVSKLNLGKTFGYGAYPDPRQTLSFATDCKAFDNRILLKAFDLSRGHGNSVESVIIEYKACTFGALAGFAQLQ